MKLGRVVLKNGLESNMARKSRESILAYYKAYNDKNYALNKDKILEHNRKYAKENPEKMAFLQRKYRKLYPERYLNTQLKYRHGLSLDWYKEVEARQKSLCAICQTPKDETKRKRLVIDHCHNKGNFRGLLCDNCNVSLGLLKENIKTLQRMIRYIKRDLKLSPTKLKNPRQKITGM